MLYEEIKSKVLECVPKSCPICGSSLLITQDLMHVMCGNPDCDGKISRKLEIAAKALGIDNIGPAVAKDLVDCLGIRHIYQLFDLTVEDLQKIPRFQEGLSNKIYNSVHSGTSVSFAQFIRACQFTRVGEGTSNDIANAYSTLNEFLQASPEDLMQKLGGMSIDTAKVIIESVRRVQGQITNLAERITINYPEKVQVKGNPTGKDLICVVTGPLGFGSRPEFQETFGVSYGIKWASAVSKNTDILVTNETTPTGKYRKAQELQSQGGKIKIMTEEDFLSYIGAEKTNTADARVEATKMAVSELKSFDGQVVDL